MENLLVILLCLIPFSLLTGPFIPDLLCSLSCIFFLIICLRRKNFSSFKNIFFYLFFIWCIYLILRSLFSVDYLLSLESSLFYIRFGVMAIAISWLLNQNNKFIHYFTNCLLISIILVLFDSFLQYFTGYNLVGYFYSGHRLSSFFGDEKILGSYLARFFPLLFGLLIITKNDSKIFTFFALLLLILSDIIIYLSGERTAFFLLILGTFTIVLLVTKWKFVRLISFIVSLTIIVFISIYNQTVKERMISNTITQTNILGDKIIAFTPHHQAHYLTALKMFLDQPLFGIGPKIFRILCSDEKYTVERIEGLERWQIGCSTHPHNTYMQLLAETGIIGLLPVLLFFLYICYIFLIHLFHLMIKKKSFLSDFRICLYTSLLITLWPIIPTGSFFNNWLSIIYYLPMGFLLYKNKTEQINK